MCTQHVYILFTFEQLYHYTLDPISQLTAKYLHR